MVLFDEAGGMRLVIFHISKYSFQILASAYKIPILFDILRIAKITYTQPRVHFPSMLYFLCFLFSEEVVFMNHSHVEWMKKGIRYNHN